MKKVSLADVAAMPSTDDDESAEGSGAASYDAAVSELADVLGVADDKLDAFKAALEAVIMTCPE